MNTENLTINKQLLEKSTSQFKAVTENMAKIEINGNKVLTLLHKKAIEPRIQNHISVLEELQNRIKIVKKELNKIPEIPNQYKKGKAIDKLKNDFFYRVNELFNTQLKQTTLPELENQLDESLDWYINKIKTDIFNYPIKLRVTYPDHFFSAQKTDNQKVKSLKRIGNFKKFLSKEPISQKINFRKIAYYFQYENRLVFLSKLLEKLEEGEIAHYYELRKMTTSIINQLERIDLEKLSTSYNIYEELLDNTIEQIASLIEEQKQYSEQMFVRMKVEYLRNLEQMQTHLELIDANSQLKKYKKSKKYYDSIQEKIEDFPENEHLKVKTLLNKIVMELAVNAAKNRLHLLQSDFLEDVRIDVKNKFLNNLDKVISQIQETDSKTIQNLELKLDDNFETTLFKEWDEYKERTHKIVNQLPETLQIYGAYKPELKKQETIDIPITRMGEYYLKSRYNVILEDQLNKLIDAVKRAFYSSKDIISFRLQGRNNKQNAHLTSEEISKESQKKLSDEVSKIQDLLGEFKVCADKQLKEIFDPLSSEIVEESAHDFTSGLGQFQREQVLTGIEKFTKPISLFAQRKITKLLYERDKSIFVKKKSDFSSTSKSYTSQLIQLKEYISPTDTILKALPPYYVSLFNGKSHISKDFWVKRVKEEAIFHQAIKRYKSGNYGGILVLGDRNIGKTSFCKNASKQYLKSHNIIDVFPTIHGNASIESFTLALKKATGIREKANIILSKLPKNTVLIFHDLELYWEKSEDGHEVISYLCELINTFSNRVLFIVNMNVFTHKLISQSTDFNDYFIENLLLEPMYAESLKQLILKRHQSSGIKLAYKEDNNNGLSEIQLAQLFSSYSLYSKGNVGDALNSWLSNILDVSTNKIIIKKPYSPSLDAFEGLREDWILLLTQLVLHKRISLAKIIRTCKWNAQKADSMILAFTRTGLLVEVSTGIHELNGYMYPFVVEFLKEKKILG